MDSGVGECSSIHDAAIIHAIHIEVREGLTWATWRKGFPSLRQEAIRADTLTATSHVDRRSVQHKVSRERNEGMMMVHGRMSQSR
jgi:hypothetical protein